MENGEKFDLRESDSDEEEAGSDSTISESGENEESWLIFYYYKYLNINYITNFLICKT